MNTSLNALLSKNASAFGLVMSDDALVTFGAVDPATGQAAFHDDGFMDVNAVTIAGFPLNVSGLPGGVYIHYSGDGVQQFGANGPTKATYGSLTFQVYGYTGTATFGHDAKTHAPTVTGASNVTELAHGDLTGGSGVLNFTGSGGISGEIDVRVIVGGQTIGMLDVAVQHRASDIGQLPGGAGITLDHGTLTASFIPAVHG